MPFPTTAAVTDPAWLSHIAGTSGGPGTSIQCTKRKLNALIGHNRIETVNYLPVLSYCSAAASHITYTKQSEHIMYVYLATRYSLSSNRVLPVHFK